MLRADWRSLCLVITAAIAATAAGCGARSELDVPTPGPANRETWLVFGGSKDGFSPLAHITWLFDGSTWRDANASAAPPARHHAMATLWKGQGLLFGGSTLPGVTSGGLTNDTWLWNGSAWSQAFTAHAPTARESGAIATLDDGVVLFGGYSDTGADADTWVWNGADWSERTTPVAPVWRHDAGFASLGATAVLFGGYGDAGAIEMADDRNDTWTWDGSAWTEQHPAHVPPARQGAVMATLGDRIVLFGGSNPNGLLSDTWTWNGADWEPHTPLDHPPLRVGAAAGVLGGELYVTGGFDPDHTVNADVWAWNGTNWTNVGSPAPAILTYAASMSPIAAP